MKAYWVRTEFTGTCRGFRHNSVIKRLTVKRTIIKLDEDIRGVSYGNAASLPSLKIKSYLEIQFLQVFPNHF